VPRKREIDRKTTRVAQVTSEATVIHGLAHALSLVPDRTRRSSLAAV
jgi:hypothetical protein